MTNNFSNIQQHIDLNTNPDAFYFLQIIKRRKDNPDMSKGQQVLKSYYVNNSEYLIKKHLHIKSICIAENARAYINLNKRSYERTAIQMIKYLADSIYNKQYENCKNAFEKVAGRNNADDNKKWILDVDEKSLELVGNIVEHIVSLKPIGSKLHFINPTPNGYHIICKPFDPRGLVDSFPEVEIKKDNPTILYVP